MIGRPIVDLIAERMRLGWRVTRLHINQPAGERAVARIGWHASDLGLEPDETITAPPGVTITSWQAVDDDLIEIAEPWSDAAMHALCRAVGSVGYERQTALDGASIAWLADLPIVGVGR